MKFVIPPAFTRNHQLVLKSYLSNPPQANAPLWETIFEAIDLLDYALWWLLNSSNEGLGNWKTAAKHHLSDQAHKVIGRMPENRGFMASNGNS